jgi:hypothetical protein
LGRTQLLSSGMWASNCRYVSLSLESQTFTDHASINRSSQGCLACRRLSRYRGPKFWCSVSLYR